MRQEWSGAAGERWLSGETEGGQVGRRVRSGEGGQSRFVGVWEDR